VRPVRKAISAVGSWDEEPVTNRSDHGRGLMGGRKNLVFFITP